MLFSKGNRYGQSEQHIKLGILWDRVLAGDKKVYAELHGYLYKDLYYLVVRLLKDSDLADDILQDLFIKFWQTKEQIGPIVNVKAYFRRSAQFSSINFLKCAALKASRISLLPDVEPDISKEDKMVVAETEMHCCSLLRLGIDKLPKKQREIIHMRFYGNMEYSEIAEITGINYQSVLNNVYRGVKGLKTFIQPDKLYVF